MAEPKTVPVMFYPVVDGSMTSNDGQAFFLKVQDAEGAELMLGLSFAVAVPIAVVGTGIWIGLITAAGEFLR